MNPRDRPGDNTSSPPSTQNPMSLATAPEKPIGADTDRKVHIAMQVAILKRHASETRRTVAVAMAIQRI